MTTEADLLRAVVDDPEDDAVRLVLADWWEERGDPRGELVRVQMLMAALLKEPASPLRDFRLVRAADRERELLGAPGRAPPELGPGVQVETDRRIMYAGPAGWPRVVFCRGFVEEVSLPLAAWLAHGPRLVRAAPLRRVTLSDREPLAADGTCGWLLGEGPGLVPGAVLGHISPGISWGRNVALAASQATYANRAAALDGLSLAALRWARAEAARLGLP